MKKRILFVEDNSLLLQMYVMMLEGEQEHWEVSTAESGAQALELLGKTPFDVVVSDMRMPKMSGIELLTEIRRKHPRCSRIIVSGLNDQEEIARSLGSTHQFLAKPFDVKALRATLGRICHLDAYLRDETLRSLVSQFDALPSFPSLYVEIMKELSAEEPSIDTIAGTIAKDPAMTAKILQIVNSAAIGLSRKVGSPFEAVQYLGLSTVRSLVLSAHIFSCFEHTSLKGFSVNELWEHGTRCARLACMILQFEEAEPGDTEDAYIAGMLHDIGKLMLADSMPDAFQKALAAANERAIPLHQAEQEVFGATHAGVAAYLLGLWGLPASIVEAVAFHHSPGHSSLRVLTPLAAVHAANAIEHEMTLGIPLEETPVLDRHYLAEIEMERRLDKWREEAHELFELRHAK